jgi:hypothetical protein
MFNRNAISGFDLDERLAELSRLGVVPVTGFDAARLCTAETRLQQAVARNASEAEIEAAAGEYLLALPEPACEDTELELELSDEERKLWDEFDARYADMCRQMAIDADDDRIEQEERDAQARRDMLEGYW